MWQILKEELECLTCLNSNLVLSIIETLQKLLINFFEALVFDVFLDAHHDFPGHDDRCKAEFVHPVVIKATLQSGKVLLEVLEHLITFNELLIQQDHGADDRGLANGV